MTEKTIIEKMTFYDVVTLIVPGALVCCAFGFPGIYCPISWLGYVAEFGVVMMIGLLLKTFGAWWSGFWFRNNTDMIREEHLKLANIGSEKMSCEFLDVLFFDPLKFISGPIMRCFYTKDNHEWDEYNSKYDVAYSQPYYEKRIDTVESHVAFLQTWFWALIACLIGHVEYVCQNICQACNVCQGCLVKEWKTSIIIAACYISVVVMIVIQKKIYKMVWEAKETKTEE